MTYIDEDASMDMTAKPVLPEHVHDDVLENINEASVHGVHAAFAYDRKGFLTFDSLGKNRNRTYGVDTDPIVVQVTYIVEHPSHLYSMLSDLHVRMMDEADRENRIKIQEKMAAAQAELDRLCDELESLGRPS